MQPAAASRTAHDCILPCLSAFCVRLRFSATLCIMDDGGGDTTVGTEFAVDRHAMGEAMGQRLEGFSPLNMMNMEMTGESTEEVSGLDPSAVRARVTDLLTNGAGKLHWSSGPPLAAAPTLQLIKMVKQSSDELLDRHRADIHHSCGAAIVRQAAGAWLRHLRCAGV